MKTNKNSWHANIYKEYYRVNNYDLPINFCDYFWKFLWAFLTLPFWCISCKITNHEGKGGVDIFIGVFFYISFWLLGVGQSMIIIEHYTITNIWLACFIPVMVLILFITGVLIFLGILFFVVCLHEGMEEYGGKKHSKNNNIFVIKFRSWKDEYCPKIDWE